MDILTAQAELRRDYIRGGPGAIVSGIVWLVAAIAQTTYGVPTGFGCLFFGGMLIFPVSLFIVRVLFRWEGISKNNPGGTTVMETVFPMIGGLISAWLLLPYRPNFVFPLSAIAVGTHYFGFRSAYGDWSYWGLAGIMSAVGFASIFCGMPSASSVPYWIAAIEITAGCWFTWSSILQDRGDSSSAKSDHSGES